MRVKHVGTGGYILKPSSKHAKVYGISVAAVLLVLFLLSLWKPSVLHEYVVGDNGELELAEEDGDWQDTDVPDHVEAVAQPAPASAKVHGHGHDHGSNLYVFFSSILALVSYHLL